MVRHACESFESCCFTSGPFRSIATSIFSVDGTDCSWQEAGNDASKWNPVLWEISLRTIFAAFARMAASPSWSQFIASFNICCIPSGKMRTMCFPSLCSWAWGKYCRIFSLNRLLFISFRIPRSWRRFSYNFRRSTSLKLKIPSSTEFSMELVSSIKALASFFCSSFWDSLDSWNCLVFLDLWRFRSSVRQVRWYFASMAIRSPPEIFASRAVSCKSVAIRLIFASASRVLNSWRWPSSLPQKMHEDFGRIWRSFRRFSSVAEPGSSKVSSLFRSALCNLSLANFLQQDLCHFARCATKSSTVTPSSKHSFCGNLSILRNAQTLVRRVLYGAVLSPVSGPSNGHLRSSLVFCWQITHALQSMSRFHYNPEKYK